MPDQSFAAVDLGSNSFHMIVARIDEHGQLRVVDRLREPVRLADGLTDEGNLEEMARARALDCLARFGQRLREIGQSTVRAVGTNTLRAADQASDFLPHAEEALGHNIDIISGIEEARLIYEGVAHSLSSDDGNRLVVDIGGGSTELIIGEGLEANKMNSCYMGCVSMSKRFFSDGRISEKSYRNAETAARQELEPLEAGYIATGWSQAAGASGTVRAIGKIVSANGWCAEGIITREALKKLRKLTVESWDGSSQAIKGLSDSRAPVFPGGLAILSAIFKALDIREMVVSSGALREGLLYDMIGSGRHQNVRSNSVDSLAKRCGIDRSQAQRVATTAEALRAQIAYDWELANDESRDLLLWAATLHECGLMIAHDQFQKHGAYIIRFSRLLGFSQQEKYALATIVRCHRRKFPAPEFQQLDRRWKKKSQRVAILLRLSVSLNRSRSNAPLPDLQIRASDKKIDLTIPEEWSNQHPLTLADLQSEADYLAAAGFTLDINAG